MCAPPSPRRSGPTTISSEKPAAYRSVVERVLPRCTNLDTHRPMATTKFLATFATAAALAACGDDTMIDPPAGAPATYVLVSANDQPAPALVHDVIIPESGEHVQLFVVADTIVLSADGRYTQRAVLQGYSDGIALGRTRRNDHGVVTRTGSALHFLSDYFENLAFDGSLDAQGALTAVQDLPREGTTARYVLRRR
jgi:hypothetical protein